MLSSHLHLGLSSGLFQSDLPNLWVNTIDKYVDNTKTSQYEHSIIFCAVAILYSLTFWEYFLYYS